MISAADTAISRRLSVFAGNSRFSPAGKNWYRPAENTGGCQAGLKIIEVNPGTDSAAKGLQKNDVLTHINDRPVANMDDVRTVMLDKSVGEIITIVVNRVDENNAAINLR